MGHPVSNTHVNVNFGREVSDWLADQAEAQGRTVTEVVRRSVLAQRYVVEGIERGKQLYLVDEHGDRERIVFL